jgi:hypothetical protein
MEAGFFRKDAIPPYFICSQPPDSSRQPPKPRFSLALGQSTSYNSIVMLYAEEVIMLNRSIIRPLIPLVWLLSLSACGGTPVCSTGSLQGPKRR